MNTDILFDQILMMKSNPHYRLGDLIYRRGMRWLPDRKVIIGDSLYDNTFLKQYLTSLSDGLCEVDGVGGIDDLTILDTVMRKYIQTLPSHVTSPDEKTLYIHLRSGDVVQDEGRKYRSSLHIFNHSKLIDKIGSFAGSIDKITFVTAMHFGDNKTHNLHLFTDKKLSDNKHLITSLFSSIDKQFNLPISIFKSNVENTYINTDCDLFRLSTCKNIILEPHGGLGDLVNLFREILLNQNYNISTTPTQYS